MQDIREEIECAARSDAKVLITGESGVGKEIIARLIHQHSRRRIAPFIAINCAAVPASLLESQLFGHVRGSFTDAHSDSPGWLEQAYGGTVLLDEAGEMSLRMQGILLRFLETGEIHRVGSDRIHSKVDVRIVAATNRNLRHAILEKEFREDLYYRLNVIDIAIPPLRERKDDLPLLLNEFLRTFSEAHGFPIPRLAAATLEALVAYSWPGNIRELKNVAERLVIRSRSGIVAPSDLPPEILERRLPPARIESVATSPATDKMFGRMNTSGESFWTVVYEPFMSRDITRQDLRAIISRGLEQTRGNYRLLIQLFNVDASDYKRFLGFLRKHDCHVPFQKFRTVRVETLRFDEGTPLRHTG